MRSLDLLLQVKLIAPYLAGKSVAFVGDYDGTSLLLGLLSKLCTVASPAHMLLFDFDGRLLDTANRLAGRYGFGGLLETRLYNVFDPVPPELVGQFDWFYTNPPYGSRNNGESARLFITRGCELTHSDGAKGCIILPDDECRPWTTTAFAATQAFLCRHCWTIDEKIKQVHQYHLDDDRDLASSAILVSHSHHVDLVQQSMPYSNRCVIPEEIPHFYGYGVAPPYPHYIQSIANDEGWQER